MKRFWISLLLLLSAFSLGAELWIGARPLWVQYQDRWYFPSFGAQRSGQFFGADYAWEADYRTLQETWRNTGSPHRLIMPLVPFGPLTIDLSASPPAAPNAQHWFGTDAAGRDVLARFIYGFRSTILMALAYLALTTALALAIALLCGLGPVWLDLGLQRLIEIWHMIPFLYIAIAVTSLMPLNKSLLIFTLAIFSWPTLSLYLRSQILQVREQDYIKAAALLGLPRLRIIAIHILPQLAPFLLSFLPFALAASLVAFTSLDFLGFGLPPPEPNWGDLLKQAQERPYALWIAAPVLVGLFVVLTAVTMIGEAIRNKQNPRQTQNYR